MNKCFWLQFCDLWYCQATSNKFQVWMRSLDSCLYTRTFIIEDVFKTTVWEKKNSLLNRWITQTISDWSETKCLSTKMSLIWGFSTIFFQNKFSKMNKSPLKRATALWLEGKWFRSSSSLNSVAPIWLWNVRKERMCLSCGRIICFISRVKCR